MFDKDTAYAIRAIAILSSQKDGRPLLCREIAKMEQLPAPYLAKILERLVSGGLLFSRRGRGGGFNLIKPAAQITIYEIVKCFKGVNDLQRCILGFQNCADESACVMHDLWKKLKTNYLEELGKVKITQLSKLK